MGMFDKDKEVGRNLTDVFAENEEFRLVSARIAEGTVTTDFGEARKTIMEVARIGADANGEVFEVTSLGGAIADKVSQAEEGDLPAIVCWMKVKSKTYGGEATVLQFVRQA